MVDKAYIRVINQDANAEELARFDLSEDGSTEVAMILVNYIVTVVSGNSKQ